MRKKLLYYFNKADYAEVIRLITEDENYQPTATSSELFQNIKDCLADGRLPNFALRQRLEMYIKDNFKDEKISTNLSYQIPSRPNFFLGRSEKLKDIHSKLTKNGSNILLLTGIGGMGKTTLMQEYLYKKKCTSFFNTTIFVSVNRNLEDAFIFTVSSALNLDLIQFPSTQEKLNQVKEALRNKQENILIVIDNINEPDRDDLITMKSHFEETQCYFLITTRTIPDDFECIEVTELDTDDATLLFSYYYAPRQIKKEKKFLTKYIKEQNLIADIENLLKHIHKHTLLIELTAKAGQKKGLAIRSILEKFKSFDSKHPDLQRIITLPNHAKTTYREQLNTTTLHSYILNLFETDYLENAKEGSEDYKKAQILRYFSVLPSIDILLEDLKLIYSVTKSEEHQFENRLDDLRQMGWIKGKQDVEQHIEIMQNWYYKMHPLVKEVVFEKLQPNINKIRELVTNLHVLLKTPSNQSRKYREFSESLLETLDKLYQNE